MNKVLGIARSRAGRSGLVAGLVVAMVMGFAAPSSATYPTVLPTLRCAPGDPVIDWTIGNPTTNLTMTITFVVAAIGPDQFPATGWTSPLAPGATTTATTSIPAGMSGKLILDVYVTYSNGHSIVSGASITLPQACVPAETSTTSTSTTSTSTTSTSTTSTSTTTTSTTAPTTTSSSTSLPCTSYCDTTTSTSTSTTSTSTTSTSTTSTTYPTTTTTKKYYHGTCYGVYAGSGNGRATVRWAPPAGNAGAVTSYVVTAYQAWSPLPLKPQVFSSRSTSAVVKGLTNGKVYRFKVAARYPDGIGPVSVATNSVRVGAPAAPQAVSAKALAGKAVVRWKAPVTANGSPITGYIVTPYQQGVALRARVYQSRATTQTVTGLISGRVYRFRVAATNSRGPGPAQVSSSNAIKAK